MEKIEKHEKTYKTVEEYLEKFPPAIIDYPFETHEQSFSLETNITNQQEKEELKHCF